MGISVACLTIVLGLEASAGFSVAAQWCAGDCFALGHRHASGGWIATSFFLEAAFAAG